MAEGAPKSGEFFDGKLWFDRKGTVVTIGLNNSAFEEIGLLESVELPVEGDDFVKGEVLATVDGSKGSLGVIAPASGVIEEINGAVTEELDRIVEDPREEGWLVRINIQDTSELKEYAEL